MCVCACACVRACVCSWVFIETALSKAYRYSRQMINTRPHEDKTSDRTETEGGNKLRCPFRDRGRKQGSVTPRHNVVDRDTTL
jgi:hypothetical protein